MTGPLVYLGLLALSFCVGRTDCKMVLPAGVSQHKIIKPASDEREFIGLTTENGMRIVLISDPTTDKSAVALNAGVGAMQESRQYNGVAHLLEHMIFMGSEKYPEQDAFSKFMDNHGGCSNAYTDERSTVYTFDIAPKYFPKALDIFVNAFIKPLFTESGLDSEINAVNQEYEKNLGIDIWRYRQLVANAMDQLHPIARFFIGNAYTLKTLPEKANLSSHSLVRDYYDKLYSSNLMSLVVLARESLQELADLVLPLINKVPNKNLKLDPVPPDPMATCRGKLYKLVPVKETHRMSILWTIPEMIKEYRAAPFKVFTRLIIGSQEGSLLGYLQRLGWAESLHFSELVTVPGCSVAEANFFLSNTGIDHWEDIVTLFFQYMNLFRGGVDRWRVEELKKIFNTNFDYFEKMEPFQYVTDVADSLPLYDLEDAVSGPQLIHEVRPDLVQQIADSLLPSLCSIFLSSQKFADVAKTREQWYGTRYTEESLPKELIEKWEQCGTKDEFFLPPPNPFIPSNLRLLDKPADPIDEYPVLIMEDEFTRLWHKQDFAYKRPKAYVFLSIISSDRYWDKEITVGYGMYVRLVQMSLRRAFAQARRCNYIVEARSLVDTLVVLYGGYDDKLDKLSEMVADSVFGSNCTEKEFDMVKDAETREYRNLPMEKQSRLAAVEFGHLMRRRRFRYAELLPFAEAMTYERFLELRPDFMKHVAIDALIYGNVDPTRSQGLAKIVRDKLIALRPNSVPLPDAHRKIMRETYMPAGKSYFRVLKSEAHPANGVMMRYQMVPYTLPEYVYGWLFVEIFEEVAYDTLRTKEHLGYIASMDFTHYQQSYFVSIYVQSDRDADFVQSRIHTFMREAGKKLAAMGEQEFSEHVESLLNRILEKPKNLYNQGATWFDELLKEQTMFNRKELAAQVLRNVTKQHVIDFYERYLSPESVERRRLTVIVVPDEAVSSDMSDQIKKTDQSSRGQIPDGKETDEEISNPEEWVNSMPTVPSELFTK